MSKISVRTVCIASLAFILLISVFPLIQVLKSESRGVIDRGKYHEEIQVILENGSEWNGTHIVPYDAKNEQYVYDVEYESYRLIPLKLVAVYPEDIGAILSYRFSEFASKKTYVSESGKTVKAYQDQIDLELIDIASGEIITKTTARAKLVDESSIPVGYTTYFQTFCKEETERISAWIHDAMKEYLGYNEDANGEFLITLMSSFAEEESRSISENVTWAVRHRFSQGKYHIPCSILLGYRHGTHGEIEIDEDEAKIVRYIYWLACQGLGSTHICDRLQERGISSPGGSVVWTSNTVRSILQNEKYMGDARLQKTVTTDFLTKTQKKNEGEAPQYYVENGHPAIISKGAWFEVREKWGRVLGRKTTLDPFFGRIRCGCCGGKYGRKVWHSNTTHDVVWECNGKKAGETGCLCRHVYDYELRSATDLALHRLLARYSMVIPDCMELLRSEIARTDIHECRSSSSDLPGGIFFDDTAIRILITNIKITAGGYAVFEFLDGSTYRYRLTAPPPKGRPGTGELERVHRRMMELHALGFSAKDIGLKLGVSVNTVRSYLRRN